MKVYSRKAGEGIYKEAFEHAIINNLTLVCNEDDFEIFVQLKEKLTHKESFKFTSYHDYYLMGYCEGEQCVFFMPEIEFKNVTAMFVQEEQKENE